MAGQSGGDLPPLPHQRRTCGGAWSEERVIGALRIQPACAAGENCRGRLRSPPSARGDDRRDWPEDTEGRVVTVQAIYKPASREVLLVLSGEYRVLPEAEAASAARAINVALSVREHAQLFAPADAPIVEIMCPCPVCRSDVAGIVPCMAVIQNPARGAAPPESVSPTPPVARGRRPPHSPKQPKN